MDQGLLLRRIRPLKGAMKEEATLCPPNPLHLGTAGLLEKKNKDSLKFKKWYLKNRKKKETVPSHLKEVGISKITENGKKVLLLYRHCSPDPLGWVESCCFKPMRHDLCDLKTLEGDVLRGWWEGNRWFSRYLKIGMRITHWRRCDSVM